MVKTKAKFNARKLKEDLMKDVVKVQTERLVTYAQNELYEMIVTREFQSRTYNLLDSYVWAVYYNGKRQNYGFFGAKKATQNSLLHEWSKDPNKRIPVDGRKEAHEFLKQFGSKLSNYDGWVVVWAACAPYGKYLDPAAGSSKTNRFFVISQRYDHIRDTFLPKGRVTFNIKPAI